MVSKIRKAVLILMAAVIAILGVSCAAPSEGTTLTVMGKKSDLEKIYMKKIFDMYTESTGNKIRIISYEDAEYENEAEKKIASGDVPDIFMHFHNSDLSRFDIADNFMYMNDQPWVEDLTESARAYCTDSDGNILGLPFWESSVSGCYYNKTLLDSLGLKPAANQKEFDVLCEALLETGNTPICWAADGCSWMMQFGLDPIFADDPENLEKINTNKLTFSEIPEVTSMVQWIADAANKGWFGTDYLNTGWSDISTEMASGSAVMTFIWDTWFYTDFVPGKYAVEDFALMPVFMNTVYDGTYEGGNLNMMMVNKGGENLDAALEFLSFCADPENYNKAFDGISTVSCFKGMTTAIQSKMVTDARASIDQKERVSTAASRIIGYSADKISEAVNEMLRKKTDVAGCVKAMDKIRESEAKSEGAEGF